MGQSNLTKPDPKLVPAYLGRGSTIVLVFFSPTHANAAISFNLATFNSFGTTLGIAALGFAGFLFVRLRRQGQILSAAKRKLGEVEYMLNEAEAALQSESQVLLTWPADAAEPERMVGTLHGTASVPSTIAALMDFRAWLERDSAARLDEQLLELRKYGSPFNFGVKTLDGDLLEVDGRAAGTMTTLRFRPLAGQRLEKSESQYDAHKLSKQVERLSGILDAAPFPIWLTDRENNLSWVNRAYVGATELGSGELVLRRNAQLVKPDAIDRSKAEVKQGLLGRARAVQAGHLHAFNIHELPLDQGKAGFAIDVTPLEEIEKELDRHIKAHASTLDKLSTAIAIFGPDQRLRFFNQAYIQLWQLDETFLSSKPADGEILDRLRASRQLPEQANYREWRAKQVKSYTALETREDFWYLPDGRSLRVIAEQHPFGGVTYLYENLTKEIQLESRYNELFEVQRETLDNLAEAVALSGPDGRLRLYNPAFMRFWALDAPFLERKPHVDELAQMAGLSADSRSAWQDIKFGVTGVEANRRAHEGRVAQDERVLHYRAVPLPDGNALLTFTDVSDTVKAERALQDRAEALEAADRLKNSILTNVSYEVRTPLTSIIGFSEALELGVVGPLNKKQHEYLQDIRKSSEDLKAIIDAIIDLSAIDAGQMELRLSEIDVAELMERVAGKIVLTLEKRQLELYIEMSDDVSTIIADPDRLEQVLGNLLSNATGFSVPHSKIRMGARKKGKNIQFWVADAGRGIEPEFQPKAFERFQTRPMPGGHRGPGLGLALVKSFTELHGGKVTLESELDKGTTVVCTLPIAGPAKASRGFISSTAA